MPLKNCSSGGKSGWKWGDSGHCYTGPGAKKKAIKQGIAIEGPDKFKKEVSAMSDEDLDTVRQIEDEQEYSSRPYPTLPKSANPNDPPAKALRRYLK